MDDQAPHVLYVIQSFHDGWEDVHAESVKADALAQLRIYRDNEPGTPHRMRRRTEGKGRS